MRRTYYLFFSNFLCPSVFYFDSCFVSQVAEQVAATSWGKKAAVAKKRADMNDFDRFKCMLLKQQKARVVNKAVKTLVKGAYKSGAIKA